MAIRNVRVAGGNGIGYTYEVDSSSDYSGLTSNIYFKDLSLGVDGLIRYKSSTGEIMDIFSSSGSTSSTFTGGTVDGSTNFTGGLTANTFSASTIISQNTLSASTFYSTQSSGDEGGEIVLSVAQTNSSLSGNSVTIDIYQNKLRFFETGGVNRGAYIDLTSAGSGVASNLLTGGGGEANTASNLGIGNGLFAQKSGVDLQFKSLTSTGGTISFITGSTTLNLESYFTGGTVTGATTFTNGLTTNSISASTYSGDGSGLTNVTANLPYGLVYAISSGNFLA